MERAISATLNNVGQQLAESVGGVWTAINETPTYIPLDEALIAKKLAGDPIAELNYDDLALEYEYE